MAAHRLQPPANNFHALALDIVTVIPASLVRVSGHATGENVDGFIYMSRRVNDSVAVVLFERDKNQPFALQVTNRVTLDQHPDFAAAMRALNVQPES